MVCQNLLWVEAAWSLRWQTYSLSIRHGLQLKGRVRHYVGHHCFSSCTRNAADKIEEETFSWFASKRFYPVRIGSVLNKRYQVLGKLGYGTCSTSWLCKDLSNTKEPYVAVKVYERDSVPGMRELEVYRYLNTLTSENIGALFIRQCTDHFDIVTQSGRHICLVHPPMEMNISRFRRRLPGQKMSQELLKTTLIHLLHAIDVLHTDAGVVHTDINEKNIMLQIQDQEILSQFEEAETSEPTAAKVVGDMIVYRSRLFNEPSRRGRPILCDFGEARMGAKSYYEDVQPFLYRAPEVLLRMEWNEKVDIWNIGALIWDLFQGRHLFCAQDAENRDSNVHHLSEMVALLGLPPKEFAMKSEYGSQFFTSEGAWRAAIDIPSLSLEESEMNLEGEEKLMFLRFMRRMLCWLPEERATAAELLRDPWLSSSKL